MNIYIYIKLESNIERQDLLSKTITTIWFEMEDQIDRPCNKMTT